MHEPIPLTESRGYATSSYGPPLTEFVGWEYLKHQLTPILEKRERARERRDDLITFSYYLSPYVQNSWVRVMSTSLQPTEPTIMRLCGYHELGYTRFSQLFPENQDLLNLPSPGGSIDISESLRWSLATGLSGEVKEWQMRVRRVLVGMMDDTLSSLATRPAFDDDVTAEELEAADGDNLRVLARPTSFFLITKCDDGINKLLPYPSNTTLEANKGEPSPIRDLLRRMSSPPKVRERAEALANCIPQWSTMAQAISCGDMLICDNCPRLYTSPKSWLQMVCCGISPVNCTEID